jgi:cell division transport system ATP-binding protein
MTQESVIQFEKASIFQDDHLVLTNVDFSLAKDEFVYIIGRVGSGKSSLIKTINAELPLKTGSGTVVGFRLEEIKPKQIPLLRRKLGIVFRIKLPPTDQFAKTCTLCCMPPDGKKRRNDACIRQVLEKVDLENKG